MISKKLKLKIKKNAIKERLIEWRDGEPCNHKGCIIHISHPCEECGRQGSKGEKFYADNESDRINLSDS